MPEPQAANQRLDSLAYSLARYREVRPRLAFPVDQPDAIPAWRTTARERLLELIGGLPTERVPLDVRPEAAVARPDHTRTRLVFATRPDMDACGYLLVPKGLKGPAPAVVCIPGHGRGADDIVGIDAKGDDRDHLDGYQHDFAVQAVRKGFITLALEPLGFGRRRDPAARSHGPEASSCRPAAGAALMLGETMVGWRVWDAIRSIDLLLERPEVDPERIGMIGISGGGTVILYAAALDDRVKASVLSGSFCTFRDSIYGVSHCIDNYVPGILRDFEAADVTGLIAPRRLFCESGTRDDIFPEAGVRTALDDAAGIYRAVGKPDAIDHHFFDGGHQFDGSVALRRLAEWL